MAVEVEAVQQALLQAPACLPQLTQAMQKEEALDGLAE